MTNFNQDAFNQFVLDNDVVGIKEKPFTLKSKRTSHWYVNWRKPSSDMKSLWEMTAFVKNFVKDQGLNPDCFYGVPEGATPLGIVTQLRWVNEERNITQGGYVLPMGRGKPKEHGDPANKYFVNAPEGEVAVLEDVTTTGGSLLNTIANLQELDGVKVIATIGLTNRMEVTPIEIKDKSETYEAFREIFERATNSPYTNQGTMSVQQAVEAAGVLYFALSTATELLPLVVAREKTDSTLVKAIETEFRTFGVEPLTLGRE
jgi:orotate phosphoribosyltransferase